MHVMNKRNILVLNAPLKISQLLFFVIASLSLVCNANNDTLDWQEAITRTLEKNPSLLGQGYALKAQEGRIQQAGARINPEMAFMFEDLAGTGDYAGTDSAEASLSITWVLENAQRDQRIKTASSQMDVLNIQGDIQRLDATADTARLFMQLLSLQERLIQSERAIVLAQEISATIQQRAKAGRSASAELARANVDLAQRQLDKEDMEHEIAITKRQLAAQWGGKGQDFDKVTGDIFLLPTTSDYSTWQHTLEQNPRLRYFVNQRRWHESQLALAQAESKGMWSITTGIKHLEANNEQALVAGFSVPLNLYARQQGRITETRALIDMDAANQAAEKVKIEAALFSIHQEINHFRHIVEVYNKRIIPDLDIALAETKRGYEIGRYNFLEWQLLQQQYLEAQHTLLNAALGTQLKAIELERLTGMRLAP